MKDELFLINELYKKFEHATDIEDKLEEYFRATKLAIFHYNFVCEDMDWFDDLEKMMEISYGKLLFCLYFEDIGKLNLTTIDNYINDLTPFIKDTVLSEEPIFQLMHFKINSFIELDRYEQKLHQNYASQKEKEDQEYQEDEVAF